MRFLKKLRPKKNQIVAANTDSMPIAFKKGPYESRKEPLIIPSDDKENIVGTPQAPDDDRSDTLVNVEITNEDDFYTAMTYQAPVTTSPVKTPAQATTENNESTEVPSKVPDQFFKRCKELLSSFLTLMAGIPLWLIVSIIGITGLVSLLVRKLTGAQQSNKMISVAFIGSSFTFVNDLPRLLETMSDGHITQNSCLHGGASLGKITQTGNGMYNRWRTDAALQVDEYYSDQANAEYVVASDIYDFGACTIEQLILGQDDNLGYSNYNEFYINDGTNPCFESNTYLEYTREVIENNETYWDFVILTEQPKRLAINEARYEDIFALNETYVPMFRQRAETTPVIVQSHAFWSDNVNMTNLVDIPTFTAMVYYGAEEIQSYLSDELWTTNNLAPIIAPVGLAYLAVWEEDQVLWTKLFLDDGIHPSPYGSFLYGCVIYASVYHYMPQPTNVLLDDMSELWNKARKVHTGSYGYPNADEADFLYEIAKSVVLKNYFPESFNNVDRDQFKTKSNTYSYFDWLDDYNEMMTATGNENKEDNSQDTQFSGYGNYGYENALNYYGGYNDNSEWQYGDQAYANGHD